MKQHNNIDVRSMPKEFNFLDDAIKITESDHNLKPDWVESPAQHTEFLVNRNKKTLLVNIGESWTYGESIKAIATGIRKYSLATQLRYTIGPRMATILDSDLYQYAVPGNCNFYMWKELERILKYVSNLGYEKIYVSLQMTEPARENPLITKLKKSGHPLMSIIDKSKPMSFKSWLKQYDEIFFDEYERILSNYSNVDAILWKNFCRTNTDKIERTFKIIPTSWIEYSSRIMSKRLVSPAFYSVGWIDTIQSTPMYSHIEFDKKFLLKEFDKIEASNNFIKTNDLHNNHPNEFAHLLWAQFLVRNAGWVNDI